MLLTACGEAQEGAQPPASEGPKVACAIQSTDFNETCTLTQAQTARGTVLTIAAPDGGFRRLLLTGDGQGVVAADGAEPAMVSKLSANLIEVTIGGDRYRLPANVK